MNFWLFILVGYEAVWFAAVMGAGHGLWWPGLATALVFCAWRLSVSAHRKVEWRLVLVALALGLVLESIWVSSGLVRYAAPWPLAQTPIWLLSMWVAFAFTIVPLFGYLHERPGLAAVLGALGGPAAYWGAARAWHAADIPSPVWPTLVAMGIGWGIALPLLTSLARRWLRGEAEAGAVVELP